MCFFIIKEKKFFFFGTVGPYLILIINSLSGFTQSALSIRCSKVKSALFGWNCSKVEVAVHSTSVVLVYLHVQTTPRLQLRVWSHVSFRAGCLQKNERPDVNAGLWPSWAAHISTRCQSAASDRIPSAKRTDPPVTIVYKIVRKWQCERIWISFI